MQYEVLSVVDVREELGGEAKTVTFDTPVWSWRAGQHLPIKIRVDQEELRRSYSISSSPDSLQGLRITVKRVDGGRVSNYINDYVQVGDVIEVGEPAGKFVLDAQADERRTHYFFGAGSGITPLYAMMSAVAASEPHSAIHLVYGNTNEDSILLGDEINHLWQSVSERMTVQHVLSKPSWWSGADYWRKGRIDIEAIAALFAENPPYAQDAQYYICGPGTMNTAVREALMSLDVPTSRIHSENYGGELAIDTAVSGLAAKARIRIGGEVHEVAVQKDQTLLGAARMAGVELPFSCGSGVCGTCQARLVNGKVHMRTRAALGDEDIAKGFILSCQSLALTEELELHYD